MVVYVYRDGVYKHGAFSLADWQTAEVDHGGQTVAATG